MGTEKKFQRVKLFSGFIYKDSNVYEETKQRLKGSFSEIDIESDTFPFDITTYYIKEMGFPLFRRFVSFKELISPEELPEIKIFTNKIELLFLNLLSHMIASINTSIHMVVVPRDLKH